MEAQFMKSSPKRLSDEEIEANEAKKPKAFALIENYSTPFNPETASLYSLLQDTHVVIEIYNVLGQKVATLMDEKLPAGHHAAHWDGRDSSGQNVPAGIDLCRMQTREFVKTEKMTLVP